MVLNVMCYFFWRHGVYGFKPGAFFSETVCVQIVSSCRPMSQIRKPKHFNIAICNYTIILSNQ